MAEEQKNCKPSDCAGCAHADSCSSKPQDFKKPAIYGYRISGKNDEGTGIFRRYS